MANQFSGGKGYLVQPPFGSYVDEWQRPVNSNFGLTNALVSGTTTIDLSTIPSSTPFVTLVFANFDTTATPWNVPLAGQNLRVALTGSISYNITVFIPANNPGMWLIDNQTTGVGTVTVKTNASGSVGITPPEGYISYIYCDGTNVKYADAGGVIANLPAAIPSGLITAFGGPTIPSGWLYCNGAAVSRVTYANLFAAIGTVWGSGDGSSTFNVPNLVGMFTRGAGGNGPALGAFQADEFGSHTHTATSTDAGHVHKIKNTGPNANGGGGGWLLNPDQITNVQTEVGYANITTTIAAAGGTETRPDNFGVNYMIKA